MATDQYFIITPGSVENGVAILDGAEFHHCVRVSRVRPGDAVKLLDGRGGTYEARVERIDDRRAYLRVLALTRADALPPVDMALAIIKSPRFDLAVEKCTELGVRRLIPLASERSVWRGTGGAASFKIERIQRKVIASCKQSGQPYFPEIARITDIGALTEDLSRYRASYLADQDAGAPSATIGRSPGGAVLGIVGPEGGFSPAERSMLVDGGALPLSLGPFRLRSETAAFCLLYRLMAELLPPHPDL